MNISCADADDFIKEKKTIIKTITKFDTKEKTKIENAGFAFVKNIGESAPVVLGVANNALTMEFIEGISVYQGLELLARQDRVADMELVVKRLCDGMVLFHESKERLNIDNFQVYDIDKKLDEIIRVINIDDSVLAIKLKAIKQKMITDFKSDAVFPFRDATPKNYIFNSIRKVTSDISGKKLVDNIVYIDFSTVNTLTTQNDDFVSVLYHYMIPDDLRNKLMYAYVKDQRSPSAVVGKFVRLGRFWARRRYYQKFFPKLFAQRYSSENIDYYQKVMNESAQEVIDIYS